MKGSVIVGKERRVSELLKVLTALLFTMIVTLVAADLGRAAATFAVNDTNDARDDNPGDGRCDAGVGQCTLRAAIQEANALPGADTINVPAGTYELRIQPLNENGIASGDLDITDSLTINGAGRTTTIIDGGVPPAGSPPDRRGLDRLFEIHPSAGEVNISRVKIQEGYAAEYGGAILNAGGASVTIFRSGIIDSFAGKNGGSVDNHANGTVHLSYSTIIRPAATEGGSALNNNRDGTLAVANSTISGASGNAAGDGGGAILNSAELGTQGTITVTDSTIANNIATVSGSAIDNAGAGSVTVERSTFTNNTNAADGGAINNESGGDVTVTGSTFSGNEAVNGGAIQNGGALTVKNSTFGTELAAGNNTAAAQGGAINSTGTGTLIVSENTKFYGNSAQGDGGAIHSGDKGSVAITTATFAENSGLNGGGFANSGDGLVTVEGSDFLNNHAAPIGEGGGLHTNSDGPFELTGGAFTGNQALNGAGFSNDGDGTVEITGTKFSGNTAQGEGGGISIASGRVTIIDAEVLTNSAVVGGGGIAYQGDAAVSLGRSASIRDTTISNNTTQGTGGGIDSRGDGVLGMTASTISSNTAGQTGGAIRHVGDAELIVLRSTLSKNDAADSGGGLFTDSDGATKVENTTVSGNSATNFGGGLLVSSRATLNNVTVAENSARSGGGINNGGGDLVADGFVFLRNTIVANNPQGGNCAGTMTSLGGNIDGVDTCRLRDLSDQPSTNPLMGALASNGGPTQTHALLAGSPAQDKALCAITTPDEPPCPSIDQRGVARPNGAGHDVGAYESELPPAPPPDPTCAGRTERTVLANQDSWISQGSPATNFGTNTVLKVKSQANANSRALVRFNLPTVPPGCELVGAKLRLHASAATDGRTLQAWRLGSTWSEAGVSWANQPATAGTTAPTARSGLGYRQWNVLGQTKKMYSVQNHGFLIRDASENGTGFEQSFHSREQGPTNSPPELVLTFDDPNATPVCPTEPRTLLADADSWVNQADPTKNLGMDPVLKVKSQSGANARALVRFALPALPAGCTGVASATLRMHSGSGPEDQRLRVFRASSTWSETGVTWANQPAKSGVGTTTVTVSPEGLFAWNVLAQTQEIYSSANHGFLIRDAAEDGTGAVQELHSREKPPIDNPPQLVITFSGS